MCCCTNNNLLLLSSLWRTDGGALLARDRLRRGERFRGRGQSRGDGGGVGARRLRVLPREQPLAQGQEAPQEVLPAARRAAGLRGCR